MGEDKFYVVVGPNNNSQVEGRLYSREEAQERAEYWANEYPGERYFVCEAVSVSRVPTITTAL